VIGTDVVVSPALPIVPSIPEDAARRVRHGLADVIDWLGWDVGPKPGDRTHIIVGPISPSGQPTIIASAEMAARIMEKVI
jgi:hypothetical protein